MSGVQYADEITPVHIFRFHRAMRKQDLSARTIANRHDRLMAFMRYLGIAPKQLCPQRPRYEKALREVYADDDLRKLFAFLEGTRLGFIFELLLKTGLREQEVVYATWSSVNFERRVLRVKANPTFGFKVKDREQRDIPLPPDLVGRMREQQMAHPGALITGTAQGQPNTKLLRSLKRAVKNAGMNCLVCRGCTERGECGRRFLHKFRATFFTKLLRSGMDLRTVMSLSGHSDLESVQRYLSPASGDAMQQHIAQMAWL